MARFDYGVLEDWKSLRNSPFFKETFPTFTPVFAKAADFSLLTAVRASASHTVTPRATLLDRQGCRAIYLLITSTYFVCFIPARLLVFQVSLYINVSPTMECV